VRNGLVFHSLNDRGVPVVHQSGELVEFNGNRVPAQLEAVKEEPKAKEKSKAKD
jgi:hypothetical protein